MSSITNMDTVIDLISKFTSHNEVACLDKRSRNVYLQDIHSKFWFDKINNYFESLDLDACCYETYRNEVNWKSRYLDMEYSGLKCLERYERDYVNRLVKRYSSENLVFAMDPECYIFPKLWLQDNGYQKIEYDDHCFPKLWMQDNGTQFILKVWDDMILVEHIF